MDVRYPEINILYLLRNYGRALFRIDHANHCVSMHARARHGRVDLREFSAVRIQNPQPPTSLSLANLRSVHCEFLYSQKILRRTHRELQTKVHHSILFARVCVLPCILLVRGMVAPDEENMPECILPKFHEFDLRKNLHGLHRAYSDKVHTVYIEWFNVFCCDRVPFCSDINRHSDSLH